MGPASGSVDARAAASDLYSERANSYLRFIRLVGYQRGLRAAFMSFSTLAPDLRILDAGCGTGVTTLALHSALDARAIPPRRIDGFDLTPAMLERFEAALATSEIEGVRLARADVSRLEPLPEDWKDYDLVITASMLEYIARSDSSEALRPLRIRLRKGGTLLLFITRNNVLMRPLIQRWWAAHIYTRAELHDALEDAGFTEPSFRRFPFPYRYLDLWGHIVSARA